MGLGSIITRRECCRERAGWYILDERGLESMMEEVHYERIETA